MSMTFAPAVAAALLAFQAAQAAPALIFWLDLSGAVHSANADGSGAKAIVPNLKEGPDGVAVDAAGGKVYWTNMNEGTPNGSIQRANLDGSQVEYLVPRGGTHTPKQMQLDLVHRKAYWSDRDGFKIQRCNLDGTQNEILVSGLQNPVGMALDVDRGFFYFSDRNAGTIQRAPMSMPSAGQTAANRKDVETLFSGLTRPIDLALDLPKGMIYWTDREDNVVYRAGLEIPVGQTAASRKDMEILVKGLATPIGMALDLAGGKLYYTEGATGAVGRANLDGTAKETVVPGRVGLFGTGICFVAMGNPSVLAPRVAPNVSLRVPRFRDAMGRKFSLPPPRIF